MYANFNFFCVLTDRNCILPLKKFCCFAESVYLCSALLGKPKTKTDNNKRCQAPVGHEKK